MISDLHETKEEPAESLQRPTARIKFELRLSEFEVITLEHLAISGFRREVDENCVLLGCYAARSG